MLLGKKKVKDDLIAEEPVAKKSKKTLFIAIGVAILIVLVFVIKAISSIGKGDLNYYDTVTSIFSNELGSFKYVFDVRTGEKGSLIKGTTASEVDINNLENADVDTTSTESDTKYQFSDWNESSEIQTGDWEYPNYKLTIEGVTTSLEPLSTKFTVNLATEYYNNVLTEITCFNGNYYIDIESLRNWLVSSKDNYLVSIGSELPQGSKYLVIPENEFTLHSRYAEDNEFEASSVTGLKTMYQRFLVSLIATRDVVKSNLGEAGMKTDKGVVSISLNGDDSVTLLKSFKGLLNKSGDFYTSLIDARKNKGLYDDSQYNQAVNEKDNVINALNDLMVYLNITDLSSMNAQVSGNARKYVNGKGNTTLEANMLFSFSTEESDYMIQFSGSRSGDASEVTLPNGSQLTLSDLSYNSQIEDILYDMIDYFNITNIKMSNQLEITPEHIAQNVEDSFIKLVNEVGTAGYYVTRNNVNEFLEKYANYKVTDETSDSDKINAKLVSEFMTMLNNVTGGVIVEKEVEVEEVIEKYPDVEFSEEGADFIIRYNEDESDSRLMVLDVEVYNRDISTVSIDNTMFEVRTLLGSIYPANNETLIRNYDNNFDIESLETTIWLEPSTFRVYKLYIILSDDSGHMDLFYKYNQRGAVVEF